MGDRAIDYSDIPKIPDGQLRSMRRVGRPPLGKSPKLMITIRLDPELLERIRQLAEKKKTGYQALIHEILKRYMEKMAA